MRRINKILISLILIATMFLSIGYSAIQNVTLDIKGTATAGPAPTLAEVTNENIGEYIDLGNNVVGEETTTDDWRILYVEGNTVYAILADYLPNSTGYAANAGLDTSGTYGVYSNVNTATLLNGLTKGSIWSGLANGISGAEVNGSPTAELLMNSYNTKNGTDLDYTTKPRLDNTKKDYDLYVPHGSKVDDCFGYWLASPLESNNLYLWRSGFGGVSYNKYDDHGFAVRPVVVLPSSISATKEGNVWTVSEDGEEGGTGESGSTELPLALVTNANIGDYIDLGNNIVGTEATTDDWRILYVEGNTVYAILADYLPNSTGYAANAGLDTSGTYRVNSETDIDTLLSGLTNTTAWSGLANGISGATVTGAPTVEILMNSYNTKYGTDLDYTTEEAFLENYGVYIVGDGDGGDYGYWLTPDIEDTTGIMYRLWSDDCLITSTNSGGGDNGVRPVVALPSSLNATKEGDIWTVTEVETSREIDEGETEQVGTEQEGIEQEGTEQEGTEQEGTEQEGTEQEGTEQEGTEQEGTDQVETDQGGTEQGGVDQGGVDQEGTEATTDD